MGPDTLARFESIADAAASGVRSSDVAGGGAQTEGNALSVHGVGMRYPSPGGPTTALVDVSLRLRAGERVALLGPNGSGKTTLIKCIAALLTPTAGRIEVHGQDTSAGPGFLGRVGAVLEGSRNVYWRLTPYENARYFAGLRGRPGSDKRIRELLDLFKIPLPFTQEVGKLSTGNKQKVAIVCALAHDPSLLLLDEPTLGLDVDAVTHVKSTVRALAMERSTAFLITSHDLSFVEEVCDRFLVINRGRIVHDGSLAKLRATLKGHVVKIGITRAAADPSPLLSLPGARVKTEGELHEVEVRVAEPGEVVEVMSRFTAFRDRIVNITVNSGSLEEAYLNLLGEQS